MHTDAIYGFATNSPFYLESTVKYQYASGRSLFSLSWTSYLMAGVSSLGNGPLHNNLDVLSESSPNPNMRYKQVGRLDQERGLVCRILYSYKITDNLKLSALGKFKDGQAFTNYKYRIESNSGNNQVSVYQYRTKGINPYNGDFGSRDDAFFNVVVRLQYSGKIGNGAYDINVGMYNLYDFGTELVEYSFQPDNSSERYAMEMNIPRGFMATLTYKF